MKIRLSDAAELELEAAGNFYLQRSAQASTGFVADYDRAIAVLRQFPNAGRRVARGARRIVFRDCPYLLIYRVEGDDIMIYAVAHQKQRPGYWRKRVPTKT